MEYQHFANTYEISSSDAINLTKIYPVDNYSDAVTLTQTLNGSYFIEVLEDETQISDEFPNGPRTLYFWNTIILQEPLLL